MPLDVKVDDATIKINTDTGDDKGKLYVNLKAGGGLFKDPDTGALSVKIGGNTEEETTGDGSGGVSRGAGEDVSSDDASIIVTNGLGAAFTTMGLKVNVDDATIKINDDNTENSTEKGKLYVNVDDATIGVGNAGKIQIKDLGVGTAKIAAGAVTDIKNRRRCSNSR